MGLLLQVMAHARRGHWLAVAMVAAAAVLAFAAAVGLSLHLPVEPG